MELWEAGVFWDREEKDQFRIDVVGVKEFKDQWRKVVIAAGGKAPDPDRLADMRARTDFVLRYVQCACNVRARSHFKFRGLQRFSAKPIERYERRSQESTTMWSRMGYPVVDRS